MTIKPGSPWGEVVDRPPALVDVGSDAALAAELAAASATGPTPPGPTRFMLVTGGDLLRTVGGPSPPDRAHRYPIDLLRVTLDGQDLIAVAHVVVRGPGPLGWWRGPVVAVMNVGRLGAWDVAPRAHPNDGRLHLVEVAPSMGVRDRWQARRRLPSGTHVPHPAISISRPTRFVLDVGGRLHAWLDGVDRGRVGSLTVTVEPDGAVVYA